MDRARMERVIDKLQPEEISDALGLLRLFQRIGQITQEESRELEQRVEDRARLLLSGSVGTLTVDG